MLAMKANGKHMVNEINSAAQPLVFVLYIPYAHKANKAIERKSKEP